MILAIPVALLALGYIHQSRKLVNLEKEVRYVLDQHYQVMVDDIFEEMVDEFYEE